MEPAWMPPLQVARGDLVVAPPAAALYLLQSGSVRLYRLSPEGREVTVGVLDSDGIFGALPAFGVAAADTFAQAVSDVVVRVLPQLRVRRLVAADPDAALHLLSLLGNRVAELEDRIAVLTLRSAVQRVAQALVTRLNGTPEGPLDVTHEEIAREAGLARETVTRALQALSREGSLTLSYRRVRVLDPARLTALAG